MISKLKGIFDSSGPNWACLDVNGVFYHVFCSARTLDDLCNGDGMGYGQEVKLMTEMIVREDSMSLYGFSTPEEHKWFQVLTGVQGVGMKVALAILSVAEPQQMYNAILSGDQKTFSAADGVGPKLAARLVNELKDKVQKVFAGSAMMSSNANSAVSGNSGGVGVANPQAHSDVFADVASALGNLGYKPFETNLVITKMRQSGVEGTAEDLIPIALQSLTKSVK